MPRKPARVPLEDEEMVEILERIARSGGDTARIQAIKALRAIREPAVDEPGDEWSEIYGAGNVTPINSRRRSG